MVYRILSGLIILPLLVLMISCQRTTPAPEAASHILLENFEIYVPLEENLFGAPNILRYDDSTSALFVYDPATARVYEINDDGSIENEFGRRGSGPGEFFQVISNMFVNEDAIYVVDQDQGFIHKFDRNGTFISSMSYGEIYGSLNPGPPAPFSPSFLRAEQVYNQPFVTLNEDVLIPRFGMGNEIESLYDVREWEGDQIAEMGDVPEGSRFVVNIEELRTAISDREIPGLFKANTFVVNDPANRDELFLIYNSLGMIKKYDVEGALLWETSIPSTAEVDSSKNRFMDAMEQLLPNNSRIDFVMYNRGVSSDNGGLYLAVHLSSDNLWIHHFNENGELMNRYELVGGEVKIMPIFDIDEEGNRIFVVTEEGEIRAYDFNLD